MMELEKLEGAFSVSKSECAQLHTALEREKGLTKELSDEVVALRIRMKELESSELKLEKSELSLKDDLSKLKSLTVALMEERKTLMERMKSDEKKKEDLSTMVKVEQGKVMEVTEKLIEESKKLLKLKSEMETKVQTLTIEKGELSTKLACEIDKSKDLNSKVSQMKKRLDGFEQAEKLSVKNSVKCELGRMPDLARREDNKIKELTFEIERLKNRLKQLEVVEGDLIKTEDQYDMLEKKFMTEQDKANILSQQVEEMRNQIARNKAIEKGEEESQEEDLRQRCKKEEARTRELQADVTEASSTGPAEEDTPAVFIRKSVQEENHIMSNLRQRCLRKPTEKTGAVERCPSSGSDLSMKKSWIPWMRKKDSAPQETNLEKPLHINGNHLPSELSMSPKQGQPLHIRVTPDHQNNMATLEISSPTTEDVFSSSAPLSPNPSQPKSRITIIPTYSAPTSRRKPTTGPHGPERAKSPVTITAISRAKSPESSRASSTTSGRPLSPVSIMTVNTAAVPEASASPEPQEMTMGRAVFKVTPEKQMVPVPIRKGHNNTSIITTTEDNKIHIHLGNSITPKMVVRPVTAVTESKEMTLSTGTVLRSPRQITTTATRSTQSKVMSSITISPVTSTTSRPTQTMTGHDAQPPRTGLTRIPMSKSLKTGKTVLGSLGISGGVKMESRAETQSMRIEVKKSTVNCNTLQNGGKA
ncbi:hypothetical protein INR49_002989 [Caranx melampygus]|nr:hypothetical protein INR49_002989 [Caranx melampygus]